MHPLARTLKVWRTVPVLAGLALPALAAPARVPAPAPSRTPAPRRTLSPLEQAHFRRPERETMEHLYAELRAVPGFEEAQIATVPTSYVQSGSAVFPVGAQFATFYGDVDGDQEGEWVIGCYVPVPEPSAANPLTGDDRARIAVFDKDPKGRWKVWTSPGLGHDFSEPVFNLEEVSQGLDSLRNLMLPLALVDVDGDRRLDIAYHCHSQAAGVGGLPGIYRWDARRWVSIAPQADRFSLQDLDGDKKLEVVTGSRRVGHGTGEDDVPRVWRWKGAQYREASTEFPRYYAELASRYTECVKRMERSGEAFNRAAWEKAIQRANLLSGRSTAGRAQPRPPRTPRKRGSGILESRAPVG